MNSPLVSIIIPTYNRAQLIQETLDSIVVQTYENWECLVIDDGSTDDTAQVLKAYSEKDGRIQYFQRPADKPKGANSCRNHGLSISKGTYVNWVDSDDLLDKNHLKAHVNRLANGNSDISVSKALTFHQTTENILGEWSLITSEAPLVDEMIATRVMWITGSVLWKKTCVPATPFIEKLSSSQEWTFHLFQVIDGVKPIFIETPTYYARSHEARIGKDMSPKKHFSTYYSRLLVYKRVKEHGLQNDAIERSILKYIFIAIRNALMYGHLSMALEIVRGLLANLALFKNKGKVLKVVFFSFPIYAITKKGEKLFKV